MPLVVNNAGRLRVAGGNREVFASSTAWLFVNDWIPGQGDVVGDYVVPTVSGLGGLPASRWTVPFINNNNAGEIDSATLIWTVSGAAGLPVLVYGYFLIDAPYNLQFAERFEEGPLAVLVPGQC